MVVNGLEYYWNKTINKWSLTKPSSEYYWGRDIKKYRLKTEQEDKEMPTVHGVVVHWDGTAKRYRISSTGELVKKGYSNCICPHCGNPPTPEGHDACLGTLKGVEYACCGHGVKGPKSHRYVVLKNGKCFYGDNIDLDQYK